MKTLSLRPLSLAVVAALLLAACSSSTTSTWTIAPAQPTSTAGASAAPSAAASAPIMSMVPSSPGATGGSGSPVPGGSPAVTGAPAGSPGGSAAAGQTIKLDLTGSLSITTEDGQPVTELTVHEGETVHFVIDNTAGFPHNFHIGTPDQLSQGVTGLPGIPDWSTGVKEFDYVVTADTANLQFACIVPGHYQLMHGTFKVVP